MRICYLWNTPKSKRVTIGASERGAFIFAKKKMNYYDQITIQIEEIIDGVIPKEKLSYTKGLFRKDWLQNPDLDWKRYLSELLDRTIKAEKTVTNLLNNLNYVYLENHQEFDINDISMVKSSEVNHEGKIVSFQSFSSEHKYFLELMTCRNSLISLKEDVAESIEYHKKEFNNPPFKEVKTKLDKIPFFGSEAEFVAFFVLLTNAGLLGINDKDFKPITKFNINEIQAHKLSKLLLTKQSAVKLLTKTFFLIEPGKEGLETFLTTSSVYSKFNSGGIQRIGLETRIKLKQILEAAINLLDDDELKNSKKINLPRKSK